MKEIIPVQVRNDRQLVSARELHNALEVKRQFTDWWKQNSKSFEEGMDYMFSPQSVNMPNGGTKQKSDYLLTLDMAKELCMMSKTERGKEVRQYFIKVEKAYKSQKNLQNMDSYMIENPILRAKKWIAERQQLDEQKKLSAKQAKQLQDQEPDVIFSHTMLATNHSCKVRQLAADLTKMGFVIGQNQLYELLRLKGYISKHSCEPIGSKVKCGYFVVRHGVTNGNAWSQTLVTPKGQKNIINKCLHGKWDKEYQQVMTSTFSI
ncbi:antA/AntB antirepressor family protein [Lactobacillus helveticus]|uniref:antA/AntB antirepressor family protein n=1 Tax=Lactobacillus helveticus TaxID=1587 RepID=UPI00156594EF|nr:antA/AntB antirepressor family protein [Lactobacillus helveticus]NRO92549.1 hypothetical protein [Lactobacillus helveticus]